MMLTRKLVVIGLAAGVAICSGTTRAHAAEVPQVVKITAEKFHFTPDHITLVKGEPVILQLTSTDATHGFMNRALKVDTDIKPGKITELTLTPETAGTFKTICDHYCGLGHGMMKMTVVVVERSANATGLKGSGTPITTAEK
jgi:cytochrome c oxidase subunit 2